MSSLTNMKTIFAGLQLRMKPLDNAWEALGMAGTRANDR